MSGAHTAAGAVRLVRGPGLAAVAALLREQSLPVADLDGHGSIAFIGALGEQELVGVVGIETAGRDGLLRSLAVAESHRGRGLGERLVEAAEALAGEFGLERLYLLTEDAADYFRRLGYRAVPREHAPPAIRASAQFAALCPASAELLAKRLAAPG